MSIEQPDPARTRESEETGWRESQVRRYATRVTVAVTLMCNAVVLGGIWSSGVNLDSLIRTPDVHNPRKDVCLRFAWHRVAGVDKPVRLCSEWINLSDPSGQTHRFSRDTTVRQGADGHLYFDHGPRVDHRLFLLVGFIMAVIGFGIWLNRYLISRYRIRLEATHQGTSRTTF